MFKAPRLILPDRKCNADRMEHDAVSEIQHIPVGTTFGDDASLGCECSS
jgi:hypothetical protein